MPKNMKKLIAALALAGILLTPACSHTDDADMNQPDESIVTASPSASSETGGGSISGKAPADKPKEPEGSVHVITNDQELEEYFDSISDEEIEKLLDVIESIDITDEVDPEADPGFDQVEIPD